jgi:hypothetical protein
MARPPATRSIRLGHKLYLKLPCHIKYFNCIFLCSEAICVFQGLVIKSDRPIGNWDVHSLSNSVLGISARRIVNKDDRSPRHRQIVKASTDPAHVISIHTSSRHREIIKASADHQGILSGRCH